LSKEILPSDLADYLKKKSNKKIENEIGSFIIKGDVGQGGTSIIREVIKDGDKEEYVIKFLLENKLDERKAYKRFEQAFNAISKLKSDAILPQIYLYSLKINEEIVIPYVLMPKAKGGTLKYFKKKNRKITFEIFESIFNRMMYLLKEIHNKKIIHRDLKPENIFLLEENNIGSMVLGDFDIAKFNDEIYDKLHETTSTESIGNASFSAPEQIDTKYRDSKWKITYSADLYAFGQILHWLITGDRLHGQGRINFSRYDKRFKKYEPIVEKLLQDDSDDRFQSVEEIEEELLSDSKEKKVNIDKKYLIVFGLFLSISIVIILYFFMNNNNQELIVKGNMNKVNQINSNINEESQVKQKIGIEGSDNNLTQKNEYNNNNLGKNNQKIQVEGSRNNINQTNITLMNDDNNDDFTLTMQTMLGDKSLLNVKFFDDEQCIKRGLDVDTLSSSNIYRLNNLPIEKGISKTIYMEYVGDINERINPIKCRPIKLSPNKNNYVVKCYTNIYHNSPNECELK